jgi:hypothetical protein
MTRRFRDSVLKLHAVLVGREFARLAMADYIAASRNCVMPRREVFAHLKREAYLYPMSDPRRIERDAYYSRRAPKRFLIRHNDMSSALSHKYGGFTFWKFFACAICGGSTDSPQHGLHAQDFPVACHQCRSAKPSHINRIAGVTECTRLRLSLGRGEYTEPKEEIWHMKTTTDLRRELIADLNALKSGAITRAEARVRANIAKQIIDTVKVECVAMTLGTDAPIPVNFSGAHQTAIAAE